MKDRLLIIKYADLVIWSFLLGLMIYNAFVKGLVTKAVWIIASILMFISLIIKLIYIRKDRRKNAK